MRYGFLGAASTCWCNMTGFCGGIGVIGLGMREGLGVAGIGFEGVLGAVGGVGGGVRGA